MQMKQEVVDKESFISNEEQRKALYNISMDDLISSDLGGEALD